MATALTLGSVFFDTFEVPQNLSDLGGVQQVATHSYPGGYQTQQAFGAFPSPITWSGKLTGTTAMFRKNEIDRLRVAGREVGLSFGDKFLLGIVTACRINVHHEWLIDYNITFEPRLDVSSGDGPSDLLSAFDLINQVLIALNNMISLFELIGSGNGFSMPSGLFPLAVTLFNTTQLAVVGSFGIVANIPPSSAAAIYAAAQALLAAAQPLTVSTNPFVSSPSLDLVGYASSIVNIVRSSEATQTTLNVVNPNLFLVAAQYYGDATRWRQIAVASSISPPDPMPIGQFTLTIPAVTVKQATQ